MGILCSKALRGQYQNLDALKHHSNSPHYKKWSTVSSKYRTFDGVKFLAPVFASTKPKM